MITPPGHLPLAANESRLVILSGVGPPPLPQAAPVRKAEECGQIGVPPRILNAAPAAGSPPLPAQVLANRFRGELARELGQLEKKRWMFFVWAALTGIWTVVFLVFVLVALAIVTELPRLNVEERSSQMMYGGFFAGLILLISIAIYLYRQTNKCGRDFKRRYKKLVIPQAARLINPSFEYDPDGFSLQRFREGGLFVSPVNFYHSEDFFCGIFGATSFAFSEVTAGWETKDILGQTKYIYSFRGIYFIADFNKHFRTRVIVVPATGKNKCGSRQINPSRGEFISLEDPEFAGEFDVFAEDQVEARYILTPTLMARILALRRGSGQVSLSFLNEQVHIALNLERNLFEPSLFTRVTDTAQVNVFLNDLSSVIGIIEMLNLNTRIWSKS